MVQAATNEYRADEDTLTRFFSDECLVTEHASVTSRALYDRYAGWCRATGEDAMTQRALGVRLKNDPRFTADRTSGGRFWRGGRAHPSARRPRLREVTAGGMTHDAS